jgi:hypothetical protein
MKIYHNDIKPENVMLNLKNDLPDIYLIDTDSIDHKARKTCAFTDGFIPSNLYFLKL